MYNNTVVIGNMGGDVVVSQLANGKEVGNFSIAHTERWKAADGTDKEKTTWFNCALWDKPKVFAGLKKGRLIMVEGSVSARGWVAKDTGEGRASLELQVFNLRFLDKNPDAQGAEAAGAVAETAATASSNGAANGTSIKKK
jgi:single-strand DNA-binding protein